MIITHYGGEFFKIQFGEATLALNPVSKDSKLKPTRFGADVALVSLNNPDFNGVDQIGFGEKMPFIISGPGEYEIKGIFIKGFMTTSKYGGAEHINTIYSISLENMNLCFLGAIGTSELPATIKEELGDIDIVFLPIGGEGVLTAAEANKLATALEPKMIIPMHFDGVGDKKALTTFLKESGSEDLKPIEKLTIKKKDLEGKEGDVVVLSSQA
jgi:L-ascorbate metabolism protein UlaG (beta-lactamase superfamily)